MKVFHYILKLNIDLDNNWKIYLDMSKYSILLGVANWK